MDSATLRLAGIALALAFLLLEPTSRAGSFERAVGGNIGYVANSGRTVSDAVADTVDKLAVVPGFVGPVTFDTLDENGDGVFDALIAKVQIALDGPGEFAVFPELSRGGKVMPSQRYWHSMAVNAENISATAAGIYDVQLRFSGEGIFESGLDGPYDFRAYLRPIGFRQADSIAAATLAYSHTEFGEHAGIIVAATDIGVDTGTDRLFNVIRADVDVQVRTPGRYNLFGELSNGPGTTVSASSGPHVLAAGATTLQLDFDAGEIQRFGQPGPYELVFTLVEAASGSTDSERFESRPYLLSELTLRPLQVGATVTDEGVDHNSNGLYDGLKVNFDATVGESGTYLLMGVLHGSRNSHVYSNEEVTLAAGPQVLQLLFDGRSIRSGELDGPYKIEVVLRDVVSRSELDRIVLPQKTAVYSHLDFDQRITGPKFLLTGVTTEQGVDTNGNGLFDVLQTTIQVQVAEGGVHEWSARLEDASGKQIDLYHGTGTFAAGLNDLLLEFSGGSIVANGADGPYMLRSLVLVNPATGAYLLPLEVGSTAAYTAEQFE